MPGRIEQKDNRTENQFAPFIVSDNLAQALGQAKTTGDLLWEIACQPGKGNDILRVMAGGRFNDLLITLEAFRSAERTSLRQLLTRANDASSGMPIETDKVLVAEIKEQNSVLGQVLQTVGVLGPIESLIIQIQEISRRITYKENGRVSLDKDSFPNEPIVTPVEESLALQTNVPETRANSNAATKDLLTEAKKGKLIELLIRPKWVTDTLDALQTSELIVLVTEQEEMASLVMTNIASCLAKDAGKAFGYQRIIIVDQVSLLRNPDLILRQGLSAAKGGILYIPELHRFTNVSLIIETSVKPGSVKVVTSLSPDEWKKDSVRRGLKNSRAVMIEPPTAEETRIYLEARSESLQSQFSTEQIKIAITKDALRTTANLAAQYLKEIPSPTGAFRLLSQAVTATKIRLSEEIKNLHDPRVQPDAKIDAEDIYLALEMLTGIELSPPNTEKYLSMEDKIKERIIGQDEAVAIVSEAIRRAKAGLKDPKRPIGSFMFMGPSGVGKTELAKALSEFLFGQEDVIQLNMSEYSERHVVARLIGAPPGYVGYEEGGQLTEAVRRKPYSVVVFDEIEKAHPDVWNILLQIFEEGMLTDGHGRKVDFRNTVVILTGNVGSEFYALLEKVGNEKVRAAVEEEIKEVFRPEFLGRIDETIIFNSLSKENILQIVDLQIKKVNQKLIEQGLKIELSEEAKALLAEKGYDPQYGARPLRKVIQTFVEGPLSRRILSREFTSKSTVAAEVKDGKIVFSQKSS